MRTRHYLAGIEVQQPINYEALNLRIEYNDEEQTSTMTASDMEWGVSNGRDTRDAFKLLMNVLNKGLGGGVGVTEGVPYKMVIDSERGQTIDAFDGYVNLWDADFDRHVIVTPIVAKTGADWLNKNIDSFTFEYLDSLGKIDKNLFIEIPYCIEKKQNTLEFIVTAVSIYVIVDKLISQIKDLAKELAYTANPFTTFSSAANILIEVVYIIILLFALIGLLKNIFENIIQRVKYHYGMKISNMLEIGTNHLGLTFRSSIFQTSVYKDLVLLPEKYQLQTNTGIIAAVQGLVKPKQNEAKGYYSGTFGDLLRAMKTMFKGKIILKDSVLYFEKRNFRLSQKGYTIPTQWDADAKFKLNYSDYKSNINLKYTIDTQDRHTVQEYAGTSVQVYQQQKVTNNLQYRLAVGLDVRTIPFAIARKKTSLSASEKVLKKLFQFLQPQINILIDITNEVINIINAIIAVINKLIQLIRRIGIKINIKLNDIPKIARLDVVNQINNRIGMLKMESDYVYVPKLLFIQNKKIINEHLLYAEHLFREFHTSGLFVEANGERPCQFLIKKATGLPFSFNDFNSMLQDNTIFTENGGDGEAMSVEFNVDSQTADIEYKIYKKYTNNIELKYLSQDGK